ncbi:MAG: GTPase Era [Elusimicrobia bacterium]|nr:GTPase Era [Elusimicrobiota bacterium]
MSLSLPFRAGFVAIVGRPNAGKSTLLNALLRQKLSIVSPVAQTTRHKILGILNGKDHQVCFLDTPGLLDAAKDGLQAALIRTARIASRDDCDVLVLVVDAHAPGEAELAALQGLIRGGRPVLLAMNKSDLVANKSDLKAWAKAYDDALRPAEVHVISALHRHGVDHLLQTIVERLPESPAYYDTDQVSDRWERFFAEEIIRERIFEQYYEEVPHACAVQIEDFKEGGPDRISAIVFVEREPQKGILIGTKGASIRELTKASEKALREFLGRGVALELRVKVKPNWRRDPRALKQFGYQ